MARRPLDDFDVKPNIDEPQNETKRELEARKLREQIKALELKNKALEEKIRSPTKSVGRPERYSKEFHPKMALLFYGNGGIDREFAEFLGISEPTIHTWKRKHKEFKDAIVSAKLDPNLKVEAALYLSAIEDRSNAAQIFWLKNRMPERWREKQDIELSGKDGGPILTKVEQIKRIEELEKKRNAPN